MKRIVKTGLLIVVALVFIGSHFADSASVNKDLPKSGAGRKTTAPCKPQPPIESLQPVEKRQQARRLNLDKQVASGITPSVPPKPCVVNIDQNNLEQSKVVGGGKTCKFVPNPSPDCPAIVRYAKADKGEVIECGMDVNPYCMGSGGRGSGGGQSQDGNGNQDGNGGNTPNPAVDNPPPGGSGQGQGQGGEQGGGGGGMPQLPQIPEQQPEQRPTEREKTPEEKEWELLKLMAKQEEESRKDNELSYRLAPKSKQDVNNDTPMLLEDNPIDEWNSVFKDGQIPRLIPQAPREFFGDDGKYDDIYDADNNLFGDIMSQGRRSYDLNEINDYSANNLSSKGIIEGIVSGISNGVSHIASTIKKGWNTATSWFFE